MLGDHSRDTASNALRKNYVGVRLKQGAPLLDSAFNEQGEIAHQRRHDGGAGSPGPLGYSA